MADVTLGFAFLGGLLSFISPCVLPLVPAYIGYMGGRMTQQAAATGMNETPGTFRQRFGILTHGVFFVLGFTLFFVIFGLLTTAAVSALTEFGVTEAEVRDGIARLGGTVVVVFGLHVMGLLNRFFTWLMQQAPKLDQTPYGGVISAALALALIGFTYWLFVESWFLTLVMVLLFIQVFRDVFKTDTPGQFWLAILVKLQTALYVDTRRQGQPQNQRFGYLGSLFMGVVFSAGWTPCIGPIYGAILITASSGDSSISESATLLTAYSLGLGIPFLLTALALDQSQAILRRLQRNMRAIEAFSGAFLILLGVLIFTGQMERLTQYGNQGSLGDLSLNIEKCAVGWVEGRIQGEHVVDCLGDGPKEDFWIGVDKGLALVANPVASDVTFDEGADASPAPDTTTGLDVPGLGENGAAAGGTVTVPELGGSPASSPANTGLEEVSAAVPEGVEIGRRAPDFTAELLDGGIVSLVDYRGKVVLLNFWATWCGPCREEMPDFQTVYEQYPDDFVVLAVNYAEDKTTVREFANAFRLTYPIALDETGTINEDLYADAIHRRYPTSLLLDQDGVIRAYFPNIIEGSELITEINTLLDN